MFYQIKQKEMGEACITYGRKERCLRFFFFLVGDLKKKRLLGRTRRRCKGNIRMSLHGSSRNRMGVRTRLIWSRLGRVVGSCKHGTEPSGSIKCGKMID
jgi:hypothetical protein